MRVILISFDALEYTLVEKYNCTVLKQREYGKIDLEPYFQNRPNGVGGRWASTPEVYSTFVTGVVPKNYHEQKGKLDKEIPTIFGLSKKHLALDIPNYPKSWIDNLTGRPLFKRYFEREVSLEKCEQEYYKYAEFKASYADLIRLYGYDLVLFYFKFTDKLPHMYHDYRTEDKFERNLKIMYEKAEAIAKHIISVFDDGKTLVIVFSDHGINFKGGHSPYGFWSSNKLLGRKEKDIPITDWYNIITEWYKKKH